jgi:hypothetical protein
MITTHVLKTDCGVTIEMKFDEDTSQFSCEWGGLPKKVSPELKRKIISQYRSWRHQILQAWSDRTGKRALLIEI